MRSGLKRLRQLRTIRGLSAKAAQRYHQLCQDNVQVRPRRKGSDFRNILAAAYREERCAIPGYKPAPNSTRLVG